MGGGAWPFLVGGVTCLVNSDNGRDLDVLNNQTKIFLVLITYWDTEFLSQGSPSL
jgi:hypothetical protein